MTGPATRALRIAIGDEPAMCQAYRDWLTPMGHQVVATAATSRELIEQCQRQTPDLVLTELELPALDGIVVSVEINRDNQRQIPVILISGNQDAKLLVRTATDHIMGYLTKPVKPIDLAAAIHFAVFRFEQYVKVLQQSETLAQALADRKIIERAKGVVMRRGQVDEEEAFRRLQRMASTRNQRLIEVARTILIAEELYQVERQSAPDAGTEADAKREHPPRRD